MPERVYMNRIAGEERIHVELTAADIEAVVADLPTIGGSEATRKLHWILTVSRNELDTFR